jgi:hypothetical protein
MNLRNWLQAIFCKAEEMIERVKKIEKMKEKRMMINEIKNNLK